MRVLVISWFSNKRNDVFFGKKEYYWMLIQYLYCGYVLENFFYFLPAFFSCNFFIQVFISFGYVIFAFFFICYQCIANNIEIFWNVYYRCLNSLWNYLIFLYHSYVKMLYISWGDAIPSRRSFNYSKYASTKISHLHFAINSKIFPIRRIFHGFTVVTLVCVHNRHLFEIIDSHTIFYEPLMEVWNIGVLITFL